MPARLPRRLDMRERVGDARRRSATVGELHLDHEHNLVRDVRTAMCGCRHSRRSRATTRRTRSWLCHALQGTGSAGICGVRLHAPRGSTIYE